MIQTFSVGHFYQKFHIQQQLINLLAAILKSAYIDL